MSIDVSTLKLAELTSTALGSKTTLDEVLKVWYSLGKIINGQLEKKKGIKLPSFGTFSLSTTLQPLFIISNEFASQYSLKQKNIGNIEKIPTVLLNLSQLAKYASIERDQTEKIYSKFLYTVGRSILEGRSVSVTIHRIAEIVIINNELKCEFISDYIAKFPAIFQIANEHITRRTFIKNVAEKTLKPKTDIDAYDAYSLSSPSNIPTSKTMNRRNSSSSMPLTKQSLDQLNQRPISRNSNNNNANDPRQIAAKAISNNIKGNSNDTIIDRIRAKIIERGGSNGIRTLSRLLSIMDDNGDKRLSKEELKFGLRDYGIDLSTNELETTFSYFDRDKNGFIDFNEFLIGIRGPLPTRRKQFIRMAFDTLDSDKSGYITADEILLKYNFDWSPDVKSGKKTVKEAAKDFMAQWDRQDNDGIVSYEEFEDYYKDVSASIDDDTYFELMMRNAWHIAGGEGAAANSSNRRVLVTKADGSQSVETINNDLGLRSKDKDGMKSRLDQQGIKSSNIDLYGFSDNTVKPTISKSNRNILNNNRNSQNTNRNDIIVNHGDQNLPPTPQSMIGSRGSQVKPAVRQAWGNQKQSNEPLRTNSRNQSYSNSSNDNDINLSEKLRQILYNPPISLEQLCNKLQVSLASYNPRIAMSAFKTRIMALDPKLNKNTASLLWNSIDTNNQGSIEIQQLHDNLSNKFGKDKSSKANVSVTDRAKAKILERCGGQAGIKGLTRVLAVMDNNGDKRLTKDELKFGLSDYGIELNIRELDDLFFYFDRDRNGFIDINEFLVGMRGDLNDNRRKFVKLAFDILDTDKSGYITTDEIAQAYDVTANPDVISGKKTKEQALHDFMSQWDRIDSDGIVTYEEFEDYYKEISASIDGDEYFELMMRNAWHIAGGEGAAANSSNRRVLVTKADGSQSVETINNDLGLRSKDKDGMKSRLDQQGIKSSNIDLYGFSDNTDKPNNNRSTLRLGSKSSQRKDSKDKLTNRRSNGRL